MNNQEINKSLYSNDEPTYKDSLDRDQYAIAFANIALSCETPMVIGLYGGWGVGKTSLMNLIKEKLDKKKTISVWFDPWQHQFDENPVISLVHVLADNLESKVKEECKKLITVIAAGLSAGFIKKAAGISFEDVRKIGLLYEEENFQIREARVHLKEYFEELINKTTQNGEKRIVFFIDDLDRCMPKETLKVIEALKLYLNVDNCVFFLGVDKNTLKQSLQHSYGELEINDIEYLDKIVQLPFTIPPIEQKNMKKFVKPLIPEELKSCRDMLVDCLGENPRQVKRFINVLILNDQLARQTGIENYNPKILSLILLVQLKYDKLYQDIINNNGILSDIKNEEETESSELIKKYFLPDDRLLELIRVAEFPDNIEEYIYLTKSAGIEKEEFQPDSRPALVKILKEHILWLQTNREQGERADLSEANLSRADLRGTVLREANLRRADFWEANLSEADLSGADLNGAHLRLANLRRAHLMDANLSFADLIGTNLSGAYLSGADLSGADLMGADLSDADLSGAIGITTGQLKEVKTLYNAKLNSEIMEEIKIKYPHLLEKPARLG